MILAQIETEDAEYLAAIIKLWNAVQESQRQYINRKIEVKQESNNDSWQVLPWVKGGQIKVDPILPCFF